jgi:hypothetical protein
VTIEKFRQARAIIAYNRAPFSHNTKGIECRTINTTTKTVSFRIITTTAGCSNNFPISLQRKIIRSKSADENKHKNCPQLVDDVIVAMGGLIR